MINVTGGNRRLDSEEQSFAELVFILRIPRSSSYVSLLVQPDRLSQICDLCGKRSVSLSSRHGPHGGASVDG
jgi:hypothetical protein